MGFGIPHRGRARSWLDVKLPCVWPLPATQRDGAPTRGMCDRQDDGDGIRECPMARLWAAWLPRGPARCRGCTSHRPDPATRETTTSTLRRSFRRRGRPAHASRAILARRGRGKFRPSPHPVPANPGSPSPSLHTNVVFHPSDSNQARLPGTSDTFSIGRTARTVHIAAERTRLDPPSPGRASSRLTNAVLP